MVIVFIAEVFEWRATISVNGVIAAHLVTNHNFSDRAIWNEFLLAVYLSGKEIERDIWSDICTLEKDIQHCIKDAYEYRNNTFHSHPEYYIAYFEMRHNQCQILHNLHYEMKKIRTVPAQAGIVAEYMLYLTGFINECNHPSCQMNKLHEIFNILKTEDLPKTREEFENRALVYHIMMDIEDFLKYKIQFINELDEAKMKIYWKNK